MRKPFFENLSFRLKNDSEEYRLSFGICLFVFSVASFTDIILSIRNNELIMAIFIGGLALWNIAFLFINYCLLNNRKKPIFYIIILLTMAFMLLIFGFSTGCYFYLFPVTLIYAFNNIANNKKVNFNSIFFVGLIFVSCLTLFYLFFINSTSILFLNNLLLFRLGISVFLSAILINHFSIAAPAAVIIKKSGNNFYEGLFQSNNEGYIVVDKESKEIVDFNQHTALLFELPAEIDLSGLYISQLMMRYLAGNSVNLELLMNNIPDNWHGEGTFITHKKREFNARIHSFTYVNDDKEYQVLCINDLAELKKIETELNLFKDKLDMSAKVKTRFLSTMSHELRTPLNGIIGSANLILAEPNLAETVKTQLKMQLYSSEHMLSIINDILDFSKIESGKMEINKHSFNLLDALQALVHSVESQFAKNKIELIYNFDPELKGVSIVSDIVKLRQVLYNLLSNALKFTIDGKVILNVLIENADTETITISFNVKDTGIGIKKEKQNEIFEDFAQVHAEDLIRRFGGTGLGLTISEKLVNLFGGKIEVESEFGEGANFYFTLTFPKSVIVKEVHQKIEETENYSAPTDIRGVRILIVEDNEINSAILQKFLLKWGVRIHEAGNGIHALELLKYHKFDLILMDLEMPEMNGYTAVKIIRETDTEIPIIAFTATLLEDMDSLIINDGFNDYVLKPFNPADLKRKIEKFVPHRKIEYA